MKVLMISGDPAILDTNSVAGYRAEEYKQILGELDIVLCFGKFTSFLSAFFDGYKLMRKKKIDVITAQSPEHWILAWIFSLIFDTPWQMQIHTDIFSPYFVKGSIFNKLRVTLAKFLIPRASSIRVVSERIKKTLEVYDARYMALLPIFVDTEKIKNSSIKTDLHQKYPERFIILMISRLTKEKNIGFAIDAASSLIRANRRIMLLIVGDGPERQNLESMIKNYELSDNIIIENWTNDVISFYKTCDLFLLTSNYEGYGMTLVEAAAAGAKIISSDVGIAPEILEKENIFKVGDKDDLVSKLKLSIEGKINPHTKIFGVGVKSAKSTPTQTKEKYLRLYKESLEQCLKK